MTLVVLTGGIDLSVGSVLALAGAVFGVLIVKAGAPLGVAVLRRRVRSALLCGLANGWVACAGGSRRSSSRSRCSRWRAVRPIWSPKSQTRYLGVRVDAITIDCRRRSAGSPVFIAVAIVAASSGCSRHWCSAARSLPSVPMTKPRAWRASTRAGSVLLAFAMCGALAGAAAVAQAGRLAAADPNAGIGLELEAIAAVVIGGTSLAGGRGSVISSALGAMVMPVLGAGLAQMGVQEPTRRLMTGAVIVTAAAADQWRRRRSTGGGVSVMSGASNRRRRQPERGLRRPRASAFRLRARRCAAISFDVFPGGKGGNQACAAARLGGSVAMVGQVGGDAHGAWLRRRSKTRAWMRTWSRPTTASSSGVALITIAAEWSEPHRRRARRQRHLQARSSGAGRAPASLGVASCCSSSRSRWPRSTGRPPKRAPPAPWWSSIRRLRPTCRISCWRSALW